MHKQLKKAWCEGDEAEQRNMNMLLTRRSSPAGREPAGCRTSCRCFGTAGTCRSCPQWQSSVQGSRAWWWLSDTWSAGRYGQYDNIWSHPSFSMCSSFRSLLCVCVCVPYGLWTADDALHDVISDLLPVVLVDVEGKDDLAEGRLPVLPVLTHHVLQVDGRCTHRHRHRQSGERVSTCYRVRSFFFL